MSRKLIRKLAAKNEKNYNYLKVAEECAELSKELIDLANKPHKGSEAKLAMELGDLELRIMILKQMLGPSFMTTVSRRVNAKIDKYKQKLKDGKYRNI